METKTVRNLALVGVGAYLLANAAKNNQQAEGLGKPASKRKAKPKRKKKVKDSTCRTYGNWLSTEKDENRRSKAGSTLASKKCKTRAQIKKGTSKVAQISKLAKKIRKPGEEWKVAVRRASKQL